MICDFTFFILFDECCTKARGIHHERGDHNDSSNVDDDGGGVIDSWRRPWILYIYIYIASYNNSDIHILKKIKNKNTYKNLTNEKPSKRETIKIKKT